jgi:hypothetical protein
MRQANNKTGTRIVLKELASIMIKQWLDSNQTTIARPHISTDLNPAIYLLTTGFV